MILVCIGMVVGAMIMCGGLFVGGLCISSRHRDDISTSITAAGCVDNGRAKELIDEIMQEFDFGKVCKVMAVLNWTWAIPSGNRVPSVTQMREVARGLLRDAIESKGHASTGGFKARYFEEYGEVFLSLEFIIEDWEVCV